MKYAPCIDDKLRLAVFLVIVLVTACGGSNFERENAALRARVVVLEAQNETLRRQVRAAQRPAPETSESVELPGSAPEDTGSITISIAMDGTVYYNTTAVDDVELARLASRVGAGGRAVIAADRRVPYVRVIAVMDVLRANGITHLSLAAQGN